MNNGNTLLKLVPFSPLYADDLHLYYSWFQLFLQDILNPDPYQKIGGLFFFVFGKIDYGYYRIFLIILYLIDLAVISGLLYLLFWLPVKVIFWISQGFRQK